jgi:hypothetical protein
MLKTVHLNKNIYFKKEQYKYEHSKKKQPEWLSVF